jgi:hypothetical protein
MSAIQCAKCGTFLTPGQAGYPCPNCQSLDRNITVEDRLVLHDKVAVAKELARRHFEIEPGITQIATIWEPPAYEVRPDTPIKLLEVNTNTFASGVIPVHFGPALSHGVPFPSVIVEVTPDEFEKIKRKELALPNGWELGEEIQKRQS